MALFLKESVLLRLHPDKAVKNVVTDAMYARNIFSH
jgi:hypothetical protein